MADARRGRPEFPFGREGQPSEELPAPEAAGARVLHEMWQLRAGAGSLPKKSSFRPGDMVRYLPNIYLIDILGEAADFRIRLFGTELTAMLGHDYTGTNLSETAPELHWRGEIYALAYRRRAPVFYRFGLGPFGRDWVTTENALFPLADEAGRFAYLLCFSVRTDGLPHCA